MTNRPKKCSSDLVTIQVTIQVGPHECGDREIEAAASRAVQQALQHYNASLRSRVREIGNDPRVR